MILIQLFLMFVGLTSSAFGGGYVMIPSLIKASEAHHWATASDLADILAIAGMSPGPVAINAAVGYGYKVAGIPGAFASFSGVAVSCGAIVVLVAAFFFRIYRHPKVQAALYGMRPVITAVILFAAIGIALKNNILGAAPENYIGKGIYLPGWGHGLIELKSLAIGAVAFILLLKTKTHPLLLIAGAGLLGILLF